MPNDGSMCYDDLQIQGTLIETEDGDLSGGTMAQPLSRCILLCRQRSACTYLIYSRPSLTSSTCSLMMDPFKWVRLICAVLSCARVLIVDLSTQVLKCVQAQSTCYLPHRGSNYTTATSTGYKVCFIRATNVAGDDNTNFEFGQ